MLLTMVTDQAVQVPVDELRTVEARERGFDRLSARYGFMERPDLPNYSWSKG